mgnify:CR=1 FL=1
MNDNNKYLKVYNWMTPKQSGLSWIETGIMAVVCSFQEHYGACTVSNEAIATYMGINARHLQRLIAGLRKKGVIGITRVGGKREMRLDGVYKMSPCTKCHPVQNVTTGVTKSTPHHVQNVTPPCTKCHPNIVDNIINNKINFKEKEISKEKERDVGDDAIAAEFKAYCEEHKRVLDNRWFSIKPLTLEDYKEMKRVVPAEHWSRVIELVEVYMYPVTYDNSVTYKEHFINKWRNLREELERNKKEKENL